MIHITYNILRKVPFRGFRGAGVVGTILLYSLPLLAQPATERPKLVVGIMIDGLQQEHINAFRDYFETDGLKAIIEGGSSFRHVRYDIVSAGNAPDMATVMTGTTPSYHGIAGNVHYNRNRREEESVLLDPHQVGIGTDRSYSAHRLLASTLVDELMLATSGNARTYAVAIDPETAIMFGGHTARSVAWIDDTFLKWVTTGYYSEGLSPHADLMNVNGSFDSIANVKWTPLFPTNSYVWNKDHSTKPFSYLPSAPRSKETSQTLLRNTPASNTLVTELALKLIKEEQLGKGYHPDLLLLQYTVRTPGEPFASVHSIEKEDMYLRLDKELKRLLAGIEWEAGLEHTLVFVFSNKSDTHTPIELGDNKIPAGYFSANRSVALLNTYLMALYGQERWVDGYSGKNIFLNRRKIEEMRMNLKEMQETTASFMLEFEGIRSAYTAGEIRNQAFSHDLDAVNIRNSYHKDSGGDVVISLLPGWIEVDNRNEPVGGTGATTAEIPVFFYGWKIPKQKIERSYDIIDLAPTITSMLGIPAPNACIGRPMEEIAGSGE